MHIVHLSSVHSALDPRIRMKQLGTVSRAGWEATFVSGDLSESGNDGISVIKIWPGNKRRSLRLILTAPLLIFRALFIKADIYHLHDPELLAWAWILKIKRVPLVYDIHEDYLTSIRQKEWIPKSIRSLCAKLAASAEQAASRLCHLIIAERYYKRRFPGSIPILNYPSKKHAAKEPSFSAESRQLLYTGNITEDRGALHMAALAVARPDLDLVLVGRCDGVLAEKIFRMIGSGKNMKIIGIDSYIPHDKIREYYEYHRWLAGLAIFPDTDDHRDKELTKFFEYMAAGLPIIASKFPSWQRLIEKYQVGICVDPENTKEIGDKIDYLLYHPEQALEMGRKGQEAVRYELNWETEGSRLIEFYKTLSNA